MWGVGWEMWGERVAEGGGVEGSNKPKNIVMQVVYMGIMQPTHTIAGSENESFYFVVSVKIE